MIEFFKKVSFRSMTLSILKTYMKHEPSLKFGQKETFNEITTQVIKAKGNEFDAAIGFMIVQLNILLENALEKTDEKRLQETLNFVREKLSGIFLIKSRSTDLFQEWLSALLSSEAYRKFFPI